MTSFLGQILNPRMTYFLGRREYCLVTYSPLQQEEQCGTQFNALLFELNFHVNVSDGHHVGI